MEAFKNGRMFSSKYCSVNKQFKIPHVIVFANYTPDLTQLSMDRWKLIDLANVDTPENSARGVPNNVKEPPAEMQKKIEEDMQTRKEFDMYFNTYKCKTAQSGIWNMPTDNPFETGSNDSYGAYKPR